MGRLSMYGFHLLKWIFKNRWPARQSRHRGRFNKKARKQWKKQQPRNMPRKPNAVVTGLEQLRRVDDVLIGDKDNGMARVIDVPILIGPVTISMKWSALPSMRKARATSPLLPAQLRLVVSRSKPDPGELHMIRTGEIIWYNVRSGCRSTVAQRKAGHGPPETEADVAARDAGDGEEAQRPGAADEAPVGASGDASQQGNVAHLELGIHASPHGPPPQANVQERSVAAVLDQTAPPPCPFGSSPWLLPF